jgi:hypothetical protein
MRNSIFSFGLGLALTLSVAGVSVASNARADDAADSSAEARKRYADGIAAFEHKDYGRAVEDFAFVYRTTGQTKHLWNLALAEYEAHRTYDALLHLREYVAKPDFNAKNEARAHALIAELSPRVAHVTIVAPDGGEVTMDGRTLGVAPLKSPVDVDPSREHVIVVRRGQAEARRSVPAPGPQDVSIELSLPAAAPPPAPAPVAVAPAATGNSAGSPAAAPDAPKTEPAAPPASADRADSGTHGSSGAARTWLTVGLGVGAVALAGAGLYMGIQSSNDSDDAARIRSTLPANGCPASPGCAALQSALSDQDSHHSTSTLLFAGAGVLAVGAVASFLFLPHGESSSSSPSKSSSSSSSAGLVPVFAPGVAGAGYSGVF